VRAQALLLFASTSFSVGAAAAELPRVHLLATGGTIAGGAGGSLRAEDLARAVPELAGVAALTLEDFANIGSSRMTPEIQLRLARRVRELFGAGTPPAGVVITHGTDTLEETAFLLDLLVADARPVVFAAAQRPAREPDSDGPRNLLNAVRIACSAAAAEMGVLVTLNGEIHAAREVRKTHAIALDAFRSPEGGPIGHVDGARVLFTRRPLRRLALASDAVEPRVDLLTLTAGDDGHLVSAAVSAGAQAIVVETFGRGNVPPPVMDAVRRTRDKGVVVVFTTRTRGGRVEISEEARKLGVVSGEDVDGLKARMLLVAALPVTREPARLQGYFSRLSGNAER
jgi:L-asparaginase